MRDEFSDSVTKTVVDFATQVRETEDKFIFETIAPFCRNTLKRTISKKELEEILLRAERMKWIPVSEGFPTDDDYRYYMVLVENHIEDVPMFCQCDPYYGFGYYREIFDPVSLGYVDTEFNTLEELNYEKALYWMPLPEPPYEGEE